jgi:hypothetical protein
MQVEIITAPYWKITAKKLSEHPVYYAKDRPQFSFSNCCLKITVCGYEQCCIMRLLRAIPSCGLTEFDIYV